MHMPRFSVSIPQEAADWLYSESMRRKRSVSFLVSEAVEDAQKGAGAMYPSVSEEAGGITDAAFREAYVGPVERGPVDIPSPGTSRQHRWAPLVQGKPFRLCADCGVAKAGGSDGRSCPGRSA